MTKLTHPVTGHEVDADDKASAGFWEAAGYRAEKSGSAKKAPAKKSASKKSSK